MVEFQENFAPAQKLAIYNGIIGKAFKMINFDWLWTIKYKMSIKSSVTLDHSIYIPIYFLINFFCSSYNEYAMQKKKCN